MNLRGLKYSMANTNFDRLAPFIQEYIYKERWETLHEVQEAACDVIFDTDENLLLLTHTASGKTEAAFLPILTDILENPSESVAVLYIAPLKALINDQFYRLEEILKKSKVTLTKWHGDASRVEKEKLLKTPSGILQITPESLEAMLMLRKNTAQLLFSDLKYIVIDEMHNFMASDRGVQLTSIIERICKIAQVDPRRVGLSATLSDIESAKKWISMGTNRVVNVPKLNVTKRRARVMMYHFFGEMLIPEVIEYDRYYEHIYALTQNKKSIIFSNRRSEVEGNINFLKQIAAEKKDHDIFQVHHGSISKVNREFIEQQMKGADVPIATGATVTLELGIDLGNLDRVIQTGSPFSVSSLAQRLGRSGRRKNEVAEMFFVFKEEPSKKNIPFYRQINWEFLKCIALIELYRIGWVEPIEIERLPYNILLHQTLSVLRSEGVSSPARLAERLLGSDTFKSISLDDYKILLRHMVETKLIEQTDEKELMFGAKGEGLIGNYDFYTVFETPIEYSVKEGTKEIGLLYSLMPVGERFLLSGRTWEVVDVELKSNTIFVKFVGGVSSISWDGDANFETNTTVLQMMKKVLYSQEICGYLDDNAKNRLGEIRESFIKNVGLSAFDKADTMDFIDLGRGIIGIFHWLGSRRVQGLILGLLTKGIRLVELDNTNTDVIIFVGADKIEKVKKAISEIDKEGVDIDQIGKLENVKVFGKYTSHLPEVLKQKKFLEGYVEFR